ncbi:hypothetical protein NHH73_23560 [Oxalobacteraceae bacterium OTU3CINTB1]|nr:hypothetical protein NHH73_23560 [Oxalobacteraceae bacterium OTU3CINTB1]
MEIIVTDLTRFKNNDLLCMAGVTADGQTCIRPMRAGKPGYLSYEECKKAGLLPGAKLEGVFTPSNPIHAPHVEDNVFSSLKMVGSCSSDEFEAVLRNSAVRTVADGFGMAVNDKVLTAAPDCSIITLAIRPHQISILAGYNGEGVKATVVDDAGQIFRYLPITDLGFFDYVGNPQKRRMSIDEVNEFIADQERLYLRIGLSRHYQAPDSRAGYWLQINGIFTFPDYQKIIRKY